MGKATKLAMGELQQVPYTQMQGTLVLKDRTPDGNEFVKVFTQENLDKGAEGRPHIEESLFAKLKAFYGGDLSLIPNNAGLVFFGWFSPCKQCVLPTRNGKGRIARIADELLANDNRGLTLKFVFQVFYTLPNWETAIKTKTKCVKEKFWANGKEALLAYEKLGSQYGYSILPKTEESTGRPMAKFTRRLAFSQLGSKSTSVTAYCTAPESTGLVGLVGNK